MRVRLEFKIEDMWIGVYWKSSCTTLAHMDGKEPEVTYNQLDIWVCLLPCLPIHITI
jgi:hypothetical protein